MSLDTDKTDKTENHAYHPNICHKIIAQFRLEDLVWSMNLDIDYIKNYLITNLKDEQNRTTLQTQCVKAINDIKKENLNIGYYTKTATDMIEKLNEFKDTIAVHLADYNEIYKKALPYIHKNKQIKESVTGNLANELELCLSICHNLFYVRVNDMTMSLEMQKEVKYIGEYLAYLGNSYEKYASG